MDAGMRNFLLTKERLLKKEIAIKRAKLKEIQAILNGIKPVTDERISESGLHSNTTIAHVHTTKGVDMVKSRPRKSGISMALRKVIASFIHNQGGFATFHDIYRFLHEKFPGYITNNGFIDNLLYRNRDLFYPNKNGYQLVEGEMTVDAYADVDEGILNVRDLFREVYQKKYGKDPGKS